MRIDPHAEVDGRYRNGDSMRLVKEITCTNPVEVEYSLYRLRRKDVPNKDPIGFCNAGYRSVTERVRASP